MGNKVIRELVLDRTNNETLDELFPELELAEAWPDFDVGDVDTTADFAYYHQTYYWLATDHLPEIEFVDYEIPYLGFKLWLTFDSELEHVKWKLAHA